MQRVALLLVIVLSSALIIPLIILQPQMLFIQEMIAVLVVLVLILIRLLQMNPGMFFRSYWIYVLYFFSVFLVQLIVISTGGIQSPFFMLLHFFMLGSSLVIGFSSGVVFLISTALLLLLQGVGSPRLVESFLSDPGVIILYSLSLFLIMPISYELTKRYHLKDALSKELMSQIQVQESILEELEELIIVTDAQLIILSVNTAVARTLHLSDPQLLGHSITEVLFLKMSNGEVATNDSLAISDIVVAKKEKTLTNLTLFTKTNTTPQKVTVHIRPHEDIDGKISQLSFIIASVTQKEEKENQLDLEQANVNLRAKIQSLKRALAQGKLPNLMGQISIIEKYHESILFLQSLENHPLFEQKVLTDIAALGKQVIRTEEDIAQLFNVTLDFQLPDFGEKDVKPLLAGNYAIHPEELTGPFFTVPLDVQYWTSLLQNCLSLSILLASGSSHVRVIAMAVRRESKDFLISITTTYPAYLKEAESDLFKMYYGKLAEKTTLRGGSGMEGFIVKKISDELHIPFTTRFVSDSQLEFSFRLIK